MKFNLNDAPSCLTSSDIKKLVIFNSRNSVRREIQKLYRKELNSLIKKEFKKISLDSSKDKFNPITEYRGLFDKDGHLIYGWFFKTQIICFHN